MTTVSTNSTMTNDQIKSLALGLLHADTESEVIEVLTHAGLWQDEGAWRLYGDRDGNFATIGNQQSRPEAALIEKIVNSVDARLMNECLCAGIEPMSSAAPPSIRRAVSRYFEGRELEGEIGGTVRSWPQTRQLEQSQFITLAATGGKTSPSLVIADCGEGQTPARMPDTFLSIDRSNKLRIPFVQGKFNMGGTGVLKFCGKLSRLGWQSPLPARLNWSTSDLLERGRDELSTQGDVRSERQHQSSWKNGSLSSAELVHPPAWGWASSD